jgi:hypothetical protein
MALAAIAGPTDVAVAANLTDAAKEIAAVHLPNRQVIGRCSALARAAS